MNLLQLLHFGRLRPTRSLQNTAPVRKGVQIAFLITLVGLAGVTEWQVLQASRAREPVYQGKRLSAWLEAYRMHGMAGVETWQVRQEQQEADEAVRHAGTNALPTLLRMLRAHDSALKAGVIRLAERKHLASIKLIPAEELNYRACWAFGVLRAKAQSAVPALLEIASQDLSGHSRYYALTALASIGPPAKEAIPSLLALATNTDSAVRLCATNALNAIDPAAAATTGMK